MIGTGIIILFLLGIGLTSLFLIVSRSKRLRKIFNVTSNVHFTILKSFIVLLLVMTIAVEWFYPSSEASHLPPKATESSFQDSVFNNIIDGHKPDDSRLSEKRTHEVGNSLTIEEIPYGNDHTDILIERKEVNDGVIEEFIYEPIFIFNDYNFSSTIGVTFPEWQEDTLTFLEEPALAFEFVSFETTAALNQLIDKDEVEYFSNNFSSSFSSPVIHLIVPKDLEIIDPYDQVIFVDEWREDES